ncbi:winged helix-turn-helix transcriptional regulator [Corallococcus llansteffanensis]|uniref:Transcriptional regulator n=1 Tax=Corallococcus llansteffanensis TaxID=2316731 RepID=A0A3A8QW30_9BACT|nr:helix-turn-helix domain-containing protein [Corallococcus llansteffanensis]RKH69032.1 transcriptional regulator [Corallococcus llansteffanensis]
MLRRRKNKTPPLPPLCPLAECMKLLGGAWTANLVWRLSGDPRRFSELRADIPRISAKVLSARLRALEKNGVLTRHAVASSPPSVEYALTALGRELIPVIEAIVQVGMKLQRMEEVRPRSMPGAPPRLRARATHQT